MVKKNRKNTSGQDEEFEVEEICGERSEKLLVKWVGYNRRTWEPKESIPRSLYNRFLKNNKVTKENRSVDTSLTRPTKLKESSKHEEKRLESTDDQPTPLTRRKRIKEIQVISKVVKKRRISTDAQNTQEASGSAKATPVSVNETRLIRQKQIKETPISKVEEKRKSTDRQNTVLTLQKCAQEAPGSPVEAPVTTMDSSSKLKTKSLFPESSSEEGIEECSESDKEYEIEKVIDEDNGMLKVKWVGYPDATWEPKKHIPLLYYNRFLKTRPAGAKAIANVPLKKIICCTICKVEEKGGRQCAYCKSPVHHMCSNELLHGLGVPEIIDVCFCSAKCLDWMRQAYPVEESPCNSPDKTAQDVIPQVDEILVGKNIAFAQADEEDWMSSTIYPTGSLFLVGIIARQKKNEYEIRWTLSEYQGKQHIHYINRGKAKEGIVNFEKINKTRLGIESWDVLCKPFDETGNPADLWDQFEEVQESYMRFESNHPLPLDLKEVESIKSMEFRANAYMAAPEDLYTHEDGTIKSRLKEGKKHLFTHSAVSSFLSFLPLAFWRKVVDNTNLYASKEKRPQVTLEEFMKFLGILFFMTTIDKGEYSNYWGDQVDDILGGVSAGLDRIMSLRRFKYIRKNLCFRAGVTPEESKNDPAAKIRPLLNIVKLRAPTFVDVGRNIAVDETSVACRSKFGRHLIVYNATKPTGKYHFKIYMCCCSTTWLALNFKLHCSSKLEERQMGVISQSQISAHHEATKYSSEIRKHVLEVTHYYHKTKRIVNTDNYYTSCQLLQALKVQGLYGRGTIRENSKFGHKAFMLSKKDEVPRGTVRQGVDVNHKMIGASWADGSIVNILSNADDSSMTTVIRRVGKEKRPYQSPTCIKEYNKAMQGVDRIDQLRSRFSLADGHTFQKWHNKLAMAIIDIARCNGYICRSMSGIELDSRDPHREFMIQLCSQLINGDWEGVPGDTGIANSTPFSLDFIPPPIQESPRLASPSRTGCDCTMTYSKQVFPNSRSRRECVICRFEGRYPTEKTVVCSSHNVALCTSVRASQVQPFYCPNTDITCWAKFHNFYLPAGLFNANGNVVRSSALFKSKKQFEARSRPPSLPSIPEALYYSQPEAQDLDCNRTLNFQEIPFVSYTATTINDVSSDHSSLDFGSSPIRLRQFSTSLGSDASTHISRTASPSSEEVV